MENKGGVLIRGLAEILGMAAREKRNEDKVTVLTMYDSPQLRKIIRYVLDPQVVWWDFLKGSPAPYKPNKYLDAEGRIFQELRILYMFVESGDDWAGLKNDQYITRLSLQKNPKKRQQIWIQLLESISPEDAELLCAAPNGVFPFKGLNPKIIDEAFPSLLTQSFVESSSPPVHGLSPQVPRPRILDTKDIIG